MDSWIPEGDDIRLWCELLASIVGYRFDDLDWDAVRAGTENADRHKDLWFEYSIIGTDTIHIRISYDIWGNNVSVSWDAPTHLHLPISLATSVLQKFKLVRR